MLRFCAFAILFFAAPLFAAGADNAHRILVLGDSLTAGFGLEYKQEEAFPAQLEARLKGIGCPVDVVNAGVTGNTSAQGLQRLNWAIRQKPSLVIVELGANDMLQRIDPAVTRKNLSAIIGRLKRHNIAVLLAGMLTVPGYDAAYSEQFEAVYPQLAAHYDVPLYPYFLQGVPKPYRQKDGLHPTNRGVRILVDNFVPFLNPHLAAVGCR